MVRRRSYPHTLHGRQRLMMSDLRYAPKLIDPSIYAFMQNKIGGRGCPIGFSREYTVGIALWDTGGTLTQAGIKLCAAMYGLTCDFEGFGEDCYGPLPPYIDAILTNSVDLEIFLRTTPLA